MVVCVMALSNLLFLSCLCPSTLQDRGIGNTSLSTFGVAQAALEIILMLYPFSDTPHPHPKVACSTAKSNNVRAALFTQDIVQPDIFRKKALHGFRHLLLQLKRCRAGILEKDDSLKLLCVCFCSLIDVPISYLLVSSVVGFYSLRVFEVLTPRKDDTTMTTVRTGCGVKWGHRVLRLLLSCSCVSHPPVLHLPPAFLCALNS